MRRSLVSLLATTTLFAGVVPSAPIMAQEGSETKARAVAPATDPSTWVRPEDYPEWVEKARVDGTVGVKLSISDAGKVTACSVRKSSGIADLDTAACQKMIERALFRPALDGAGQPVASTFQTSVWFQPRQRARLPETGKAVLTFTVEKDGSVTGCTVKNSGLVGNIPKCDPLPRFDIPHDESGKPAPRRYRLTMMVEQVPVE